MAQMIPGFTEVGPSEWRRRVQVINIARRFCKTIMAEDGTLNSKVPLSVINEALAVETAKPHAEPNTNLTGENDREQL